MQKPFDWDALRLVLAIARAGSLAGAARRLSVSHATVFRRLNTLEKRLGVTLFERDRGGYVPTPAGEDMAAAAARIDDEVLGVARRIVGRDQQPSGRVRLTTTDTLLDGLLAPMLAECRRRYPEIALEVAVSNALFDLGRRHADMAVRPIAEPPEALIAHRLGRVAMAVYTGAAATREMPPDAVDWIGLDDSVQFPALARWMRVHGHDSRCGYRLDTLLGIRAALRDTPARAVLPCYLADTDPRLHRIGEPLAEMETDLWLLVHPDLRRVARVRAVRDRLINDFAEDRIQARLTGQA